ncbi:MAG: transposase [Candidatus Eremiobacteraeota bacterium]|nr:transposase [Candidatus Eremiobacteraeota bacterium]
MRKRHSPEQTALALRQAEAGTPVAEIIRKLRVHETFYTWKKRFSRRYLEVNFLISKVVDFPLYFISSVCAL